MTSGLDLVASIIREGGHSGIRLLKPELFLEEEKKAYTLLSSYYLEHGELPPFDLFERRGIFLPEITNIPGRSTSVSYNFFNVLERARYNILTDMSNKLKAVLPGKEIDRAEQIIKDSLFSLMRFKIGRDSFEGWEVMEEVWEEYQANKEMRINGVSTGVLSGWEPLDELVGGYRPGDLIVFTGRRGAGKSYILARQALHAIIRRHRVVFVTMEMTRTQIFRRFAAIQLKLNPNDIIHTRLSNEDENRLNVTVDNFNQYPIKIIEGGLGKPILEIISSIKEYRPDIVFIDGSYLLTCDDKRIKSHWEIQASIHQSIKTNLALGCDLPVVCTVQQNRASRTNKDGDGIVAGSDVIEQLASILVSVSKITNHPHRRLLKLVKNREGAEGLFVINYVFSELDLDVNYEDTRIERDKIQGGEARRAQQDHMAAEARRMA